MSFSWSALHAGLRADIARHGFLIGFRSLTWNAPELAGFSEPQALLDHQHRAISGGTPDRDSIVRTLVHAAQGGGDTTQPAQTLLVLALWPGLDAVLGRLRRFRSTEDLASELVGGLLDQVGRIDLDSVNRVAATLLRNLERDMKRSWQCEARLAPLAFDETLHGVEDLARESQPSVETVIDEQRLWQRVRQVIGEDAALVRCVAVEGQSQAEAGCLRGLSPDVARKRYQRAMVRLGGSAEFLRGACPVSRA